MSARNTEPGARRGTIPTLSGLGIDSGWPTEAILAARPECRSVRCAPAPVRTGGRPLHGRVAPRSPLQPCLVGLDCPAVVSQLSHDLGGVLPGGRRHPLQRRPLPVESHRHLHVSVAGNSRVFLRFEDPVRPHLGVVDYLRNILDRRARHAVGPEQPGHFLGGQPAGSRREQFPEGAAVLHP